MPLFPLLFEEIEEQEKSGVAQHGWLMFAKEDLIPCQDLKSFTHPLRRQQGRHEDKVLKSKLGFYT